MMGRRLGPAFNTVWGKLARVLRPRKVRSVIRARHETYTALPAHGSGIRAEMMDEDNRAW